MKSVVVTGSTGLIGREIVSDLREYKYFDEDPEVFTPGRDDYVPKADYIVHAAGYGQPAKFMADPMGTINIHATVVPFLLGRLKPNGRLLYLSTSEVYSGNPKPSYTEDDIGTTTPSHPRACYIEAKRMGETICNINRKNGYDSVIARVALGYGPGTAIDDDRAIYSFVRQALTKGEIVLRDNGMALRTYCYISDMSHMLLNILFRGKQSLYNVGGVETMSVASIAHTIGKLTGAKVTTRLNQPDASAPISVKLDIMRYFEELGVRDFVPLETGLREVIAWYKSIL